MYSDCVTWSPISTVFSNRKPTQARDDKYSVSLDGMCQVK